MDRNARVLVIDDDEMFLRVVTRLLSSVGYDVFQGATGAEGLRAAAEHRPDVILLDVALPDANGIRLCPEIKQLPGLADCFVVLISGQFTESDNQAEGLEIGADGYLLKPVPPRELLARVQTMVRIKESQDEVRKQARRQTAISQFGERVLTAHNLDTLFADAASVVAETLGVDYSHVLAFDPDAEQLLLRARVGWPEELVGTALLDARPGQAGHCLLLAPEPVVWSSGDDAPPVELPPRFQERHICGGISVVIAGRDRPFGTVAAYSTEPRNFSASDANFIQSTAHMLGAIIERKRAGDALKQSEAKYSRIFALSPAAIVVLDPQGRIMDANPKLCEWLGYEPEEIMGCTFAELPQLLPQDRQKAKGSVSGHEWRSGTPAELSFINKNGEERAGSVLVTPIRDEHDQLAAELVMVSDVTSFKQAEQQLKAAKEAAEEANRTKSQFLASMSHELRTPLNAIIGFSQVLSEQHFGPLNEKQAKYAKNILDSGEHLLELINDILDLSKIEAGKMELEITEVNLSKLLWGSLNLVREKTMERQIEFDIEIPESLTGVTVDADERRLRQVLFNLLANAAKFTSDGGSIRVVLEEVNVPADQGASPCLQVTVQDTGIGIPAAQRESIFAEFYQVRGGTSGKTPGTGLGLPVSRRIVQMHGGRLWVESEGKDKGSRFCFTLPARRGHGASQ